MKAVIFANHKKDELTCFGKPKPLAEIFGKNLVEYNYDLLKNYADEIIVVCSAETKNCINEKNNVIYCYEEDFCKHISKLLNETTLFADGGAFYNCDISKFIGFHKETGKKISIAVSEAFDPSLISVNFEGTDFLNIGGKSKWKFNNMYILEKEMQGINIARYLKSNPKGEAAVYSSKEKFVPINCVWDLMNISFDLINRTRHCMHKSTFIDESACVSEKTYIGKNCKIGKFAKIGAYTVIEDNCIIKDGATVKYSTVSKNSYVGRNSEIEFSYVMENATIGDRCVLQGGNVVERDFVVCNDSVIEENMPLCENIFTEGKQSEKVAENKNKILR